MRIVAGPSQMGRRFTAYDWSASPLGPTESWPDGLRSAVAICLTTSFPTYLVWGDDMISIYNDAYGELIGSTKHARALGAPARDVWPELWDDFVGPLFREVLATGAPVWRQDEELMIERDGLVEQCYFTFSYSPLFDGERAAGVLALVHETTGYVLANRRLGCLSDLNAALADAEQVTHVCVEATLALARHHADVRAADVFLWVGDEAVLVASNRSDDVTHVGQAELAAVSLGERVVVGGNGGHQPADFVALPIGRGYGGVQGALVVELSPKRPFDGDYARFVDALAAAVTNALDGAYRRSVELGEFRRVSETLQAAMVPPAQNLPTIAARYLPATGSLAVGGDWYDVIDLDDHRRALVVGDCVGHGLDAATVMVQLRSAARAMLLDGSTPAAMLAGLDTFAVQIDGAAFATVVCAIYDRRTRQITFARAGHPPPLVTGPAGSRWLSEPSGPPLAVSTGVERTDETLDVTVEEIIVLYTDGLVERRGELLDAGFERLERAASALHAERAETIADSLLRVLQPENARDDVVLVVKRFDANPAAPTADAQ